jgi:hypothetical protein
MARGLALCFTMGDNYDTIEEFYGILVQNIYRSECGYTSLRADHFGHTPLADVDDRRFYGKYSQEIDSFVSQMKVLCRSISTVKCHYNPIIYSPLIK